MTRDAKSFGRISGRFKAQPTVLVICEDSKSNKKYLEDAAHWFRVRVKVEIEFCGNTDPLGIVRAGIQRQREFDKVFCEIDRDEHENFDQAVNVAEAHEKLSLIVSHPCFEFWYLLHFKDTRKAYARAGDKSPADVLLADLKKIKGLEKYTKSGKARIFDSLFPNFQEARARSKRIFQRAHEEKCANPSTNLHILFDSFEELAVLRPVR
ncbi:RloB family protein [Massilia alkalitolerans]|uniref:RloB family protein n=1 Tax=Massilia alkalitolerans TaxID=286638 RepID=UPI0028A64882|nr:RloB family protein [Massilia alkalitolerans]